MMGKSHLIVGSAGWLLATPALAAVGIPLVPATIAAGTVVAAGAAMMPDLDHPQATVSRSLGKVSQTFSKYFARSMGGHRKGSHSVFFAAALGFLVANLVSSGGATMAWTALAVIFITSSLLLRVLTEADGIIGAVLSAILAVSLLAISAGTNFLWLVAALVIGILLHDLGDFLTVEGIPFFYPFSKKNHRIAVVGKTDSWREKGIAALAGIAAVFCLGAYVYQPIWTNSVLKQEVKSGKANKISLNKNQNLNKKK